MIYTLIVLFSLFFYVFSQSPSINGFVNLDRRFEFSNCTGKFVDTFFNVDCTKTTLTSSRKMTHCNSNQLIYSNYTSLDCSGPIHNNQTLPVTTCSNGVIHSCNIPEEKGDRSTLKIEVYLTNDCSTLERYMLYKRDACILASIDMGNKTYARVNCTEDGHFGTRFFEDPECNVPATQRHNFNGTVNTCSPFRFTPSSNQVFLKGHCASGATSIVVSSVAILISLIAFFLSI